MNHTEHIYDSTNKLIGKYQEQSNGDIMVFDRTGSYQGKYMKSIDRTMSAGNRSPRVDIKGNAFMALIPQD